MSQLETDEALSTNAMKDSFAQTKSKTLEWGKQLNLSRKRKETGADATEAEQAHATTGADADEVQDWGALASRKAGQRCGAV